MVPPTTLQQESGGEHSVEDKANNGEAQAIVSHTLQECGCDQFQSTLRQTPAVAVQTIQELAEADGGSGDCEQEVRNHLRYRILEAMEAEVTLKSDRTAVFRATDRAAAPTGGSKTTLGGAEQPGACVDPGEGSQVTPVAPVVQIRIVGDTLVLCTPRPPQEDRARGSARKQTVRPPFRDHCAPSATLESCTGYRRAMGRTRAVPDNDSNSGSSSSETLPVGTTADGLPSRNQRSASPQRSSPRRRSPPRRGSPPPPEGPVPASVLRRLCGVSGELGEAAAQAFVEDHLFKSLPRENVSNLEVQAVASEHSRRQFLDAIRRDNAVRAGASSSVSASIAGGACARVKIAWHLPGSDSAAASIIDNGIRCDEDHCACGRYGRGGYVALSAAKANAYADASGEGGTRKLFMVLALPEEDVVKGERSLRPARTAADLPSHPTEYCFVDSSRLLCVYLITFTWVPTGRREKVVTAGARVSHIVSPSPPSARHRAGKCALPSGARRCQPHHSPRLRDAIADTAASAPR